MNELMIPSNFDKVRSWAYRNLRKPYLAVGFVLYAFVALIVAAYLLSAPKFQSDMELVLPGTGNSSRVSLNDVGQVVSQTSTPFSASSFNPRVNYKQMLSSRSVLKRAANSLNLTLKDFGKPKIVLTEQTSILNIEITALDPEVAQDKAWALYEALQTELDELRADEVARRDESIQNVLDKYRLKVNDARNDIVDFQQRALLVSSSQMEQLIGALAEVKQQTLYARSDLNQVQDYVDQLSLQLQVSPALASKALILQSDPEFNGFLRELDSASATVTEFSASWGKNHPKVIAQSRRVTEAKAALIRRTQEIAGINADDLIGHLNLDDNPQRAQLFADLISNVAKAKGQQAKVDELERTSLHLADQLKMFSREVAELDRLEKEFDLAEAVYTSAAARLEANKADVFASYPVVQMLTSPSLPLEAAGPKAVLVIAGAVVGLFFITVGLIVIWQRDSLINLLLKKN